MTRQELAEKIQEAIMDDLSDRGGLQNALEELDTTTRFDMDRTQATIIDCILCEANIGEEGPTCAPTTPF